MQRIPNILSTLRIILAPIFLFMYIQDEVVWRSLSIAVFAVAVVTDFFDGYIARLYGVQTSYGVFLDPLADKILTFAGFICLPFIDADQFPWWAVGLIVMRDVFVTGMRMLADYRNMEMDTRFTAKVKTMSQMVFLYLVLMVGVFIETDVWLSASCLWLMESGILKWMMIAVVILTVYSGLEYVYVNRDLFKLKNNNATTKTDYR
ncbi:MAG: CDP-diacylglycerol--glycerol-3-phosphate 3-phosphatidyltransferase [Balneolaceae bacterium]|nr:CDP-diacylglycerol--glycerol-3-phosphate 3-phosphatidyltransferase [Balneolaceae bacterium]